MKGKTKQARRKAIERGIKIAAISSEAKIAIRGAGLDDNRSALREIAKEETTEAQIAKVEQITKRKAKEHTKRNRVKKGKAPKPDRPGLAGGKGQSQPHPNDVLFAELKSECPATFRRTWAEAPTEVRRRFLREVLKWDGGEPISD